MAENVFSYYTQALKLTDTPVGSVFVFNGVDDGSKMIAEYVARLKEREVATFIKTPSGTNGILTIPSGYFTGGFGIDDKISSLIDNNCFIVLAQYEKYLSFNSYVILKISSDAKHLSVHEYASKNDELVFVAMLDPEVIELDKIRTFQRLMSLVMNELDHLHLLDQQ